MGQNQFTGAIRRREFLRLAGVAAGIAGGPIPAAASRPRACIFVHQNGGLSHVDTFDMKPGAPLEIRGEFRPIRTSVPGIHICEHLPLLARRAQDLVIVRSMTGRENNHERAACELRTARRFRMEGDPRQPAEAPSAAPVEGAAQWFEVRPQAGLASCQPLPWRARREAVSLAVYGEARSEAFRRASQTGEEVERWRSSYGGSQLGAACLAARRFVEAGARFVAIDEGYLRYDTHCDHFRRLREELLPSMDRALSALIDDLRERGLLASTLIVATGEFGRSPRINLDGGRDHHAEAWSALLAGGGLTGGRVVGATDATGATVTAQPVYPEDLWASVAALIGAAKAQTALSAAPPEPQLLFGEGRPVPALLC